MQTRLSLHMLCMYIIYILPKIAFTPPAVVAVVAVVARKGRQAKRFEAFHGLR